MDRWRPRGGWVAHLASPSRPMQRSMAKQLRRRGPPPDRYSAYKVNVVKLPLVRRVVGSVARRHRPFGTPRRSRVMFVFAHVSSMRRSVQGSDAAARIATARVASRPRDASAPTRRGDCVTPSDKDAAAPCTELQTTYRAKVDIQFPGRDCRLLPDDMVNPVDQRGPTRGRFPHQPGLDLVSPRTLCHPTDLCLDHVEAGHELQSATSSIANRESLATEFFRVRRYRHRLGAAHATCPYRRVIVLR